MSNAIKNTCRGEITLGVEVEEGWLRFFVKDTGVGIPKGQFAKIFTRFEKVNEFAQGTGLGLPICKSIIERLGGSINVESVLGKGSTFSFRLPHHEITNLEAGEEMNKVATTKRRKLLLVEEVEGSYIQINALLNKHYTILWVRNGEEASTTFLRERPDLVMVNIRMQKENGIEIIEKLRLLSINIPIIGLTAHAFIIEQQQALAAGCNDIVIKPYSYKQMREKIGQYIG